MLGRDLDGAQEWVRSWTAQVSTRAAAATELSDRVATVTASATGADGAVRVTVASSGVLTALELDDRVQRLTAAALARVIMATIAKAQSRLAGELTPVVRETVGVESETGQAVLESYVRRFPEPPDPADEAGDDDYRRDVPRGR
ncbi:YbaB/EbfC family nucleoid-associated protein [Plantactinospora solaniradicis]|uniref:YbaB/EbfC family nucleoid-associated protein n=1 Tax=Plantactinospora solaniradicis TaxID=1723736 RepID=A0ABW1KR90_9ACTN